MIRVHHLNNSRSQRVLWLLEETGTPYEVVRYERDKKTMLAPKALRRVHPLGKSPIVEDDGKTFAETGLIVDYLVERFATDLAPARDSELYWRYKYWLHYAEGSLMPPLLLKLVVDRLGLLAYPARPFVKSQLKLHLDFLESELSDAPWFLGERFSAAGDGQRLLEPRETTPTPVISNRPATLAPALVCEMSNVATPPPMGAKPT